MSRRSTPPANAPGHFVQQALDARGWTQRDLAAVLGKPLPVISELILGKRAVTATIALALSHALGDDPSVWLQRELQYRLAIEKTPSDSVKRRAELQSRVPWREMVRLGWISGSKDMDEVVAQVCKFLGVKSLDQPSPWLVAFRKSVAYTTDSPAQSAWCARAIGLAKPQKVARFRHSHFVDALPSIRDSLADGENVAAIPQVLADLGIRFVIVRHLPKSRIDGATMWLTKTKTQPVVAMSARYDRIDYFAFTLLHELKHIQHLDDGSFDTEILGNTPGLPEIEVRANKEAAELLVPPLRMEAFLRTTYGNPSLPGILSFAREINVHPGVVVGQLHFRQILPYSAYRQTLVPVRERLSTAITLDGWTNGTEGED